MKTLNKFITACMMLPLLYTLPAVAQDHHGSLLFGTEAVSPGLFDELPARKPDYKNAIGIRAGGTSGITFKHFFGNNNAIEGIIGLWPNAFGLTGLYEKHAGTGVAGLKFYYGGGGHITGETGHYYYRRYDRHHEIYEYRYGPSGLGIGVDGVLGIEYKIPVIPFAISLDLKPFIEVSNYGGIFTAIDPGLGIKVAF